MGSTVTLLSSKCPSEEQLEKECLQSITSKDLSEIFSNLNARELDGLIDLLRRITFFHNRIETRSIDIWLLKIIFKRLKNREAKYG